MYKAVVKQLNDQQHQHITNSIAPLKNSLINLSQHIQFITDVASQQSTALNGAAQLKQQFKFDACNSCYVIIQPALAFCKATNNPILAAKIRFSLHALRRIPTAIFISQMLSIKDALQPYVDNNSLIDYNVTPQLFNAFIHSINNYQTVENTPRSAIISRKSDTQQLTKHFKEANNICKDSLDKIIASFRFTHPDYYTSYINARRIVNQPVRHRALLHVV